MRDTYSRSTERNDWDQLGRNFERQTSQERINFRDSIETNSNEHNYRVPVITKPQRGYIDETLGSKNGMNLNQRMKSLKQLFMRQDSDRGHEVSYPNTARGHEGRTYDEYEYRAMKNHDDAERRIQTERGEYRAEQNNYFHQNSKHAQLSTQQYYHPNKPSPKRVRPYSTKPACEDSFECNGHYSPTKFVAPAKSYFQPIYSNENQSISPKPKKNAETRFQENLNYRMGPNLEEKPKPKVHNQSKYDSKTKFYIESTRDTSARIETTQRVSTLESEHKNHHSFSKPFEIAVINPESASSKFSFCNHDTNQFQSNQSQKNSVKKRDFGYKIFRIGLLWTKTHSKNLNYNFQKWKELTFFVNHNVIKEPKHSATSSYQFRRHSVSRKSSVHDEYTTSGSSERRSSLLTQGRLFIAFNCLKRIVYKNCHKAFNSLKYIPTMEIMNHLERISRGFSCLQSITKAKQKIDLVKYYSRWKAFVLINIQKEEDISKMNEVLEKQKRINVSEADISPPLSYREQSNPRIKPIKETEILRKSDSSKQVKLSKEIDPNTRKQYKSLYKNLKRMYFEQLEKENHNVQNGGGIKSSRNHKESGGKRIFTLSAEDDDNTPLSLLEKNGFSNTYSGVADLNKVPKLQDFQSMSKYIENAKSTYESFGRRNESPHFVSPKHAKQARAFIHKPENFEEDGKITIIRTPNLTERGRETQRSISPDEGGSVEALQKIIPIVFDSAAQNIIDFFKYDASGNPKKEIKNILYETILGLLDKYLIMNK